MTSGVLPSEKNVEDDTMQPIIIKKSKNKEQQKNQMNMRNDNKNNNYRSGKVMKNENISYIKKPQLTNYAMNSAKLGVQIGINPTISENDH
jgi:hypothetical protein